MKSNSVLAHLALRFASHPENLATEALAFILKRSDVASSVLVELLRSRGVSLPRTLTFETQQVGIHSAIPDMSGSDDDGTLRVVIENKFWAGLTDNQPITYLKQLPSSQSAVLAFIVPESRRRAMWAELINRCTEAGMLEGKSDPSRWSADITPLHKLIVLSWVEVLSAISVATAEQGDLTAHTDVGQLRGLCERMDNETFRPLDREELTNLEFPRRLMDFAALPSDVVTAAVAAGVCEAKGVRETGSRYEAGKYFQLAGFTPRLAFDASAWREHGVSPMWLRFYPEYNKLSEVRGRLSALRAGFPCGYFESPGVISVALHLKVGVERDAVITDLVQQIRDIGIMMRRIDDSASDAGMAAANASSN
ncbi:MAG TPA: hypothetical protein VEG32_08190 [Clostridia bacterium]|nr:hypothetical protein [Clostridia bacterium]